MQSRIPLIIKSVRRFYAVNDEIKSRNESIVEKFHNLCSIRKLHRRNIHHFQSHRYISLVIAYCIVYFNRKAFELILKGIKKKAKSLPTLSLRFPLPLPIDPLISPHPLLFSYYIPLIVYSICSSVFPFFLLPIAPIIVLNILWAMRKMQFFFAYSKRRRARANLSNECV